MRGTKSSESWMSMTYYGTAPDYDESWDIQPIPRSSAATWYRSAAQYHQMLASELLKDVENSELNLKLQAAETEAVSAQETSDLSEIIARSKKSMFYSNQIISALGTPPAYEKWGLGIIEILLLGAVAGGVAGMIGVLVSKRAKKSGSR